MAESQDLNPPGLSAKEPNAEIVAALVASAPTVDAAAEAINGAGWPSAVAGNRINVSNRVFARFIDDHDGRPTWVVYGIGDRPPVRIVTAPGPNPDLAAELR